MIDYNDSLHRYSHQGVRYISATQIVEQFKTPFDTEGAAVYVSERRGNDPDYWKQQWKDKNRKSLVRGKYIHDLKEDILLHRQVDMINGKPFMVPNINLLPEWDYIHWPDGSYPELILWNHQYQVAGRTDKAVFSTVNHTRYADILDYKSNELIRTSSYWTKELGYRMMKPPISHLMQCNWIEYQLQLSLYAFMLEQMGFIVRNITIEHHPHVLSEAPPGAQTPKPVIMSCQYMRNDILLMLNNLAR